MLVSGHFRLSVETCVKKIIAKSGSEVRQFLASYAAIKSVDTLSIMMKRYYVYRACHLAMFA